MPKQIEALLTSRTPSTQDYAVMVQVAERAEPELLWALLTGVDNINPIYVSVINKALQEKIPQRATDEAVDRIVAEMKRRFLGKS